MDHSHCSHGRGGHGLTRRGLLPAGGFGLMAAWLASTPLGAAVIGAIEPDEADATGPLQSFELADVRLHDGPFLRAQTLSGDYLLARS